MTSTTLNILCSDVDTALATARSIARSKGHKWTKSESVVFRQSCSADYPLTLPDYVTSHKEGIQHWCDRYFSDKYSTIEDRLNFEPTTIEDTALRTIINALQPSSPPCTIKNNHDTYKHSHSLMGDLLETYIASNLVGTQWHFCYGAVVKLVDIISEDGRVLQIKCRSTTENSASKYARVSLGIDVWWRFNPFTGGTNWDALNEIIKPQKPMTEELFLKYIHNEIHTATPTESDVC
ncbi:SinI family restriction endonuclease [Vibrio breoganii]